MRLSRTCFVAMVGLAVASCGISDSTPTSPRILPGTLDASVVASPSFTLRRLTTPAGQNSEAYDINSGRQSAGVVYVAGQTIDGQAVLWEPPAVGTSTVAGVPAGFNAAVAYGLTNGGTLAVTAYGANTAAYTWSVAGGWAPVPMPINTTASEARDISSSGIVVGSWTRNGIQRAYRYNPAVGFQNLHAAAAAVGFTASGAEGVQNNARVVGWAETGGQRHAVEWASNGTFTDWGYMGPSNAFLDIAAGNIVGHFYYAAHGGYDGVGFYSGIGQQALLMGSAFGVSTKGRVVGKTIPPAMEPATGMLVDLRTTAATALPMPAAATGGRANGVNTCGHSVGAVESGGLTRAAFWVISACD